jgi:hypothetical protein
MNFIDLKKGALVLPTTLFIVLSGSSAFAQSDNKTVEQRLNQIEQQLESNNWYKNITISGAIEVETNYVDGPDDNSSDITLATAEFGIEAAVAEGITANLLFLFEEDATDPPELDEGFINIQLGETPFSVTTGQFYLPFGTFESALLSDPLTLELGETRESALQLNYEQAHFHGAVFLFNGSAEESGDEEKIDSYGASAGFSHEGHGYALGVNLALAIQSTDEALALGLPQQRTAIALSVDILENTSITAELKHEEDYSIFQGGTGNNTNTGTLQLAVSF